ncbi:MAG: primosomal protein N', partial [Xenophilus sp.]
MSPTSEAPAGAAVVEVAVQTPAHAALAGLLSYTAPAVLPAGTLVRVPLGRREVLGVVWGPAPGTPAGAAAAARGALPGAGE